MNLLHETETPVALTIPHDYRGDLWILAVAMAGKAVVSTVIGMGIAYVEVDAENEVADFFWANESDCDKSATVELAGDAAVNLMGLGEMNKLGLSEMDLSVGDAGYGLDIIQGWNQWFEDEDGQDCEFDNFDELILLIEACRLRALRILSRPGHREAVEALAHAVLAPEGITGEDAQHLIREVIAKFVHKTGIETHR